MAYADLRTDYAFRKVFGQNEDLLRALLNDLLEREGERAITSLEYLPAEQAPPAFALKLSVLDVRCRTPLGETFLVEMQVLPVTGFLNRVVYNACKAYVGSLDRGRSYRELVDVVAVSICDFELWRDAEQDAAEQPRVPLLSRWRMTERHTGTESLGQVQYVFLELPKLGDRIPHGHVEWWASLFRTAPMLDPGDVGRSTEISDAQRRTLELANSARWTSDEQDAYRRAHEEVDQVVRMVDAGIALGEAVGKAKSVVALCDARQLALTGEQRGRILACKDIAALDRWFQRALSAVRADDVFADAPPD